MSHDLLVYLALVPILGVMGQLLAYWTRLPSILLLLILGVLLGTFLSPDVVLSRLVPESVSSTDLATRILAPVISLSVALILFEGGLTLRLSELKSSGRVVFRLVSWGALVTWVLASVAAQVLLDFDWRLATLLGAILTVTGPTVVAPMLRYIRPNKQISAIVKWEGIVIDPIGAILAVLVYENLFHGAEELLGMGTLKIVVLTLVSGIVISVVAAAATLFLIRRFLIPEYLHGFVFLGLAIAVFTLANFVSDEAGLVSVTLLGVIVANQRWVSIEHIIEFKENLRVFLVSGLFIVLGSQLRLGEIGALGWPILAFLGALIFLIRPLAVWLALIGTETTWRDRWFLAFLAPRGIVAAAVTSVFALRIAQLDESSVPAEQLAMLIPATFTVIMGTVTFYGLTAAPLARALGLADSNPQGVLFVGAEPWVRELGLTLRKSGLNVALVDTNFANIAAARMEGLPAYCASILSENLPDEVDFAGLGKLVAVTPNDLVNTLATKIFAHDFGKKNVYQILPSTRSSRRTDLSDRARGRSLFGEGLHAQRLAEEFSAGARCKATRLSPEFTFEKFRERYAGGFILLAVIDPAGNLVIATTDQVLKPAAGAVVIALVADVSPPEHGSPTQHHED